jgi:hypothetical protein
VQSALAAGVSSGSLSQAHADVLLRRATERIDSLLIRNGQPPVPPVTDPGSLTSGPTIDASA